MVNENLFDAFMRQDKPLMVRGSPYYPQKRRLQQPLPGNGLYYSGQPSVNLRGDYPTDATMLLPWPRPLPTVRQQMEQAALAAGIDPNRPMPRRFAPRVVNNSRANNPNSRERTFKLPPLPRLPLPQLPFQQRRTIQNRRQATVLVPY